MTQTNTKFQPATRDLIQLERPGFVKVSPDGDKTAIGIQITNWRENRYETHVQLWSDDKSLSWLTRTGSAIQVEWLDNQTAAVLRTGPDQDETAQVWVYENCTGEGWQVTDHKGGVAWFKPFAGGILFKAQDPERTQKKDRKAQYGDYVHFEQESSASGLYWTHLDEMRTYQFKSRLCTDKESEKLVKPVVEFSRLLPEPFSIQGVVPSPNDDAVYFTCWRRDDLVYMRHTNAFCLQTDPLAALQADMEIREVKLEMGSSETEENTNEDLSHLGEIIPLQAPKFAQIAAVSPDGATLLVSYQARDDKFFTQSDLWSIPMKSALAAANEAAFKAGMRCLSGDFDHDLYAVNWVERGIYASYFASTGVYIAQIDESGGVATVDLEGLFGSWQIDVSTNGVIGFIGSSADRFQEAYVLRPDQPVGPSQLVQLTDFGAAVAGWQLPVVETVSWQSADGTTIEGVLYKPADFDPQNTYPLAFVVHGGPRGLSAEVLLQGDDLAYYPTVQLVNQGVLVIKPNYRGSVGRGQAFTELNVNNLGVGDLWDLESAINHFASLGWVDPALVGCMGWSQGGYISAFAGLRSDRFKAVSVGAGISDWYTYHISNDIPDFTIDYLSGSPFRDRQIYDKTAPIKGLPDARTPVLIQHGSDDRRVPLSNAMELYRGLQEMGVPVELFIYPGMGHPITKPRENHAVMEQNLAWFEHYLLGKDLHLPE